jgi:hypothetical protein
MSSRFFLYWKMGLKPHADFPRRTSLDILDYPLKTDDLTWSEQNVNVVGHGDIAVKAVGALVTVVNDFSSTTAAQSCM